MKIYLASSFRFHNAIRDLANDLKTLGHKIPDEWWNVDAKSLPANSEREWQSLPIVRAIALRHWRTIAACDLVILVSHPEEPTRFTGANIEIGYAHGKGIPVFSIGKLERSAMYAPVIQCQDWNELKEAIAILACEKR